MFFLVMSTEYTHDPTNIKLPALKFGTSVISMPFVVAVAEASKASVLPVGCDILTCMVVLAMLLL